jgi:hypothetical protein
MDYNGRINITQPDTSKLFSMYDKIVCESKVTEYRDPLTFNWTESQLSRTFFSKENIQMLQNAIRKGVYDLSKGQYKIGQQCTDVLKIVMRSTYLSYSANLPDNIPEQINALNQIVVDYCANQVFSEAKGYVTYIHDASTMYSLIPRWVNTLNNDKKLEWKTFFGGDDWCDTTPIG